MRFALILIVLFSLCFNPLFGQQQSNAQESTNAPQSSDWYLGKPIKDIQFKGLEHVSQNELKGIIQPYIGKEYSDELFLELQSKLYALDYFEFFVPNAKPGDDQYSSLIIEFTVTERPIISDIVVTGNKNIRNQDILDVVLLKEGDMVTKTKVKLDTEAIKELYLERGFPNVEVEGTFEKEKDTNRAEVAFSINEGNQIKVKKILFSGNSFASDGTLKRVLKTKEQSLFSAGVYQENNVEKDIQNIQMYYWEHGYIDAEVVDTVKTQIESDDDQNINFITLTFYIEEGEQYTYNGISFEGNTLFTDEELKEVVRLQKGDVLNRKKLEADFARVNDLYYDNGYIYNIITKEELRDEKDNSVAYNVRIVEKGRAHIENIIIEGNEKTKDYVIYRELPFEVGDVFSKKLVMQGLQNLYNTGFFSVVEPTTPMGSVDGLMDLVINVEEGKTIDINFGITFSGAAGDFPVLGFLKWNDNNFLGGGQRFSIGTEISGLSQSLNFGFTENWFLGKRWSVGVDFSIDHQLAQNVKQDIMQPIFSEDDPNRVPDPYKGYYVFSADSTYNGTNYDAGEPFPDIPTAESIDEYSLITDYAYAMQSGQSIPNSYLMEYHSLDFSLGLSTGYRWQTPVGRISLGLNPQTTLKYLTYDESIFRPFNPTERDNLNTARFINTLGLSATWDTRDYIYNPSSGHYISQRFNITGWLLFGSRHYIKTSTKAEAYVTLFDVPVFEGWNFKMVLALSSAFSMVLPNLVIEDSKADWEVVATTEDLLYTESMMVARGWPRYYGGKALWNNWLEFRIPILEQYLWWDFFLNVTGFWEEYDGLSNMNIDDYLFSFGGGLRLTIPGLPMGFYLAKRFKTDNGSIDWQPGNMFNPDNDPHAGIDFVISFTYELF